MIQRWVIVRTALAKEQFVARALIRTGFDAWVPTEIRMLRTLTTRRSMAHSNVRKTLEIPILPRRLFAAIPVAAEADCGSIRYLEALERDGASLALCVPSVQIARFRAEIDRINAETMALARIVQTKRQKRVWKDMRDALQEIVAESRVTLEIAA
jgi:hypothetical protein